MSNSSGNEEDDEFLQAHTDEHIENDGVVLAGSVFSVEAAAELARISEELVRTREEKQTMEFKQAKKITHRDGNKSPQKINQIKGIDQYRFQSGLSEFDRVIGY
jgi:hypothetical protein